MTRIRIYSSNFSHPREVHQFLAENLHFPSYYGMNLDALSDVLAERDEDTWIVLDLQGMPEEMAPFYSRLRKVLSNAVASNYHIRVMTLREKE